MDPRLPDQQELVELMVSAWSREAEPGRPKPRSRSGRVVRREFYIGPPACPWASYATRGLLLDRKA